MDGTPIFIKPIDSSGYNTGGSNNSAQEPSGFARLFSLIQGKAAISSQTDFQAAGKPEPYTGNEFPEKNQWNDYAEEPAEIAPVEKFQPHSQDDYELGYADSYSTQFSDEAEYIEPSHAVVGEENAYNAATIVSDETTAVIDEESVIVDETATPVSGIQQISDYSEVETLASAAAYDPSFTNFDQPIADSAEFIAPPITESIPVNAAATPMPLTVETVQAVDALETLVEPVPSVLHTVGNEQTGVQAVTTGALPAAQVSLAALETRPLAAVEAERPTAVAQSHNQASRADTIVSAATLDEVTQTQLNKERQAAIQIQKAEEELLQRPTLSERYTVADAVTRRRIFEAEWARAQTLTPSNGINNRAGGEVQMLSTPSALSAPSPTQAVPAEGLPPFVSNWSRATPVAPTSANPMTSSAPALGTATINLQQQGWEKSLAKNVNFMIRENMNSLQVKVTPAELGPINLHLSVDQDKLNIQINANQSATRELLEYAAPRLREMLAENSYSSVDVNVADQGQDNQQLAGDTSDQIFIDEDSHADLVQHAEIRFRSDRLLDTFA